MRLEDLKLVMTRRSNAKAEWSFACSRLRAVDAAVGFRRVTADIATLRDVNIAGEQRDQGPLPAGRLGEARRCKGSTGRLDCQAPNRTPRQAGRRWRFRPAPQYLLSSHQAARLCRIVPLLSANRST